MLAIYRGVVVLIRDICIADLSRIKGAVSAESYRGTIEIPANKLDELIPVTDDEDVTVIASEEELY